MNCVKCGHEIKGDALFCPYCGEKVVRGAPGASGPLYQADVKKVLKSGKLVVYQDRTEFVTSSVQKAIFNYAGLVSVKKEWDHIDFITEDGRKVSCPADRKCVHEAFLYIERAAEPYLAQRRERLLSQGVRYSFPSSQGMLNDGVLNLSAQQAEFRTKSGKSDIVSFSDVKSASAPAGTLDLNLFGGRTKSFAVSRELRDEVLAFVRESIAPFLARRREDLLAQGIHFSFPRPDGGTVNVLADRVEHQKQAGPAETVFFQSVRAAGVYTGMLELALTDGTTTSFPIDEEDGDAVLAFVKEAIQPYVTARTAGFDTSFGIDERIEIHEGRGVFHILRQGGKEITDEWPLSALKRCAWVENGELSALGSVVSGGIALFKSAAKAAGNQSVTAAEERLSCAGTAVTFRTEQGDRTETIWFGIFTAGMSRNNKKFDRYLAEWSGLSEYLKTHCPECEQVEPAPPEPDSAPEEIAAGAGGKAPEVLRPAEEKAPDSTPRQDDLGIARYIEGVSQFIGSCATPMTIAFQGNQGSGEGSILKMLYNRLGELGGESLLWLNARPFSQGEAGEALSVQVGKRLVNLLRGGSPETKNQTGTLLTGLAGVVTGVVAGDSSLGKEIAGGLFNREADDSPEHLAEIFAEKIEARCRGGNGKVILFVDGLERLTPVRTVELLEAMRDFFDCKGCVFVVAADYSTILSGAQKRYGQTFDEERGKQFFDEMFKMSFRVPASSYNVQNYVKSKLEHVGIRNLDESELDLYVLLVQNSVGRDPESIDRLFSAFLLLKNMADPELYEDRVQRLMLFALLCMQARFRAVYDRLKQMKGLVTPALLSGLCGEESEVLAQSGLGEAETERFRAFARSFLDIINTDREGGISQAECDVFVQVLEFSSITSR